MLLIMNAYVQEVLAETVTVTVTVTVGFPLFLILFMLDH
jgi:hypothetical protein